MENTFDPSKPYPVQQWGGAAFMIGALFFLANKLNDMSRLFLSRPMADVISGRDTLLIFIGQVALILGFVAYHQFYASRAGRLHKIALRLLSGGGILLAIGHVSFMSALPTAVFAFGEYLFVLVAFGVLFLSIGLIWFGILNLRHPILRGWQWLPLVTGLMGFIGFFFFRGVEITAIFLAFRTLFALGLFGMGLTLWMESPLESQVF